MQLYHAGIASMEAALLALHSVFIAQSIFMLNKEPESVFLATLV